MTDYEMTTIIPKLKSELKQKGKKCWFNIIDTQDRRFICFSRYLYEGIELGKEIRIRVTDGKSSCIVAIAGFCPKYPPDKVKAPPNKTEAMFFEMMKKEGWELTKKGWPDFACFKDGKLILIEVKPKRSHRLKSWQSKLMLELVKHGIKAYRWSPDGGFEPILPSVEFPINLP